MSINFSKVAISSQTPGMQNTEVVTGSYNISSQTLTTSNQSYSQTNNFAIGASFQFVYGLFNMVGLDSTWRVLNGGTSFYNYNSSNVWAPTGTNAYAVQITTTLSSGEVAQTLTLKYQNSPNNVTVPAFTVNVKFFVLKAPF